MQLDRIPKRRIGIYNNGYGRYVHYGFIEAIHIPKFIIAFSFNDWLCSIQQRVIGISRLVRYSSVFLIYHIRLNVNQVG